jgi:hypothetical protein
VSECWSLYRIADCVGNRKESVKNTEIHCSEWLIWKLWLKEFTDFLVFPIQQNETKNILMLASEFPGEESRTWSRVISKRYSTPTLLK